MTKPNVFIKARNAARGALQRSRLRQFLRPRSIGRFAIMGAVNTIVGIGAFPLLYWLAEGIFSVNALLVMSWIITTAFAFLSHKLVTFESKGNYRRESIKFFVLSLITLGANLLVMNLMLSLTNINPVIVQFVNSVVVAGTLMVANYLGMNHFIFKPMKPKNYSERR